MGATTNYDLNIPSGSDNVNILTQITPNFETIDEVMKGNEDAGVQIASELYANNIHAITRTKSDAAAMRFTATSNFTVGDTFTVDGVQVTALAPNGATLPDQAYTIGCEVFAILKGTRLTVWAGIKATDTEKFNGQLPSYYATAEALEEVQRTATAAGELAESVNQNLSTKQDKLTNPLTRSNIVNNLTSTSTTDVLSANQGKVLADSISSKQDKLTNPLTKSDVVNNLTTTTSNVPLSAYQGKLLNDNKLSKSRITAIEWNDAGYIIFYVDGNKFRVNGSWIN